MKNKVVMQAEDVARTLERLALQIVERHGDCSGLMLVGIQRRGADIAKRLHVLLQERVKKDVAFGTLDINLYRDDWTSLDGKPHIGQSNIPQNVDNMSVLLVDDVLYTGRTIRAALEALMDYGRPQRVELLVLVDRGHRELPIAANYVGRILDTELTEHVNVHVMEKDGRDEVFISVPE